MLHQKCILFFLLLISSMCIVDRTYYIYLGLDITASQEQINLAYQSKRAKLQAIQQEQAKNNKLKLLEEAYEVLGNAEKRSLYDRLNRDLFRKDKVIANFKKLTDKNSRKSKNIMITLPVSVQDVYHGKEVEAIYLKQTACQKCKGTGAESPKFLASCTRCGGNGFTVVEGMNPYGQRTVNQNTCPICQGWGKQVTRSCPSCQGKKIVTKTQTIKIKIPKGLPDGNVIRVVNLGDEPVVGAPSDFQITIVQIPTQKWAREGQNLIHTVQISLKQALFGFSKTITHLSGQQIPISRIGVTTRDTTIIIPNQGIQNIKTEKHGKLTIKFKIRLPKFTDEQLDMWQQFFKQYNL